ncbi:MAG: alpha/beta hydrolase [Nocardioidaceae bacterium]
MRDTDGTYVTVNGLSLAYRRAGSGHPLVLLHGGFEDGRIWRRQLDFLSDEFATFAWDAPGAGGSDDPPPGFTSADYADAVAGFIEALGLDTAHLLGSSWGSTLALATYERHPTIVRSLVLASAYAGWAGSLPAAEVQRRRDQVIAQTTKAPHEVIVEWMPTILTASATADLIGEVSEIMGGFHPAGMRAAVESMAEVDFRPMLSSIAIPTLLLYGSDDVRSPLDVAESMHAMIPGSQLVVIPDGPHLIQVENAEPFNAAVREFLRGVDRS